MPDILSTEAQVWDDHFRNIRGVDLLRHPDFVAPELDDQVRGGLDALGASVLNTGILTGLSRYSYDTFKYDVTDTPDPNWNPLKHIEDDEFLKSIFERAETQGSEYDRKFVEAVLATKNESQFDQAWRRYSRDLEALEAFDENPWTYGLGTLLGIAPDIAASVMIPILTPAALATNAARITGAGLAMRSVAAARGVGAARIGAFGATEGLTEAAVQDLTRTMLEDDYLWNTLLGAGLGGLLGGTMPGFLARVGVDSDAWRAGKVAMLRKEEAIQRGKEASDFVEPDSVGAAKSPHLDTVQKDIDLEIASNVLVTLGAATRGLGRTIGRGYALISPKTLIAQYFELARKWQGTSAGNAMTVLSNITGRMFTPNVVFKHNVAGEGRLMSMVDLLNEMDAYRTSRMMEVGDDTKAMYKLIKDHYGITDKGRSISDTIDTIARSLGDTKEHMPSQQDLWRLADQIANMKRLNEERAAREVAEDAEPPRMITPEEVWHSVENMRSIPEDLRSPIWDIAEKIAAKDDEFFEAAEQRLINQNLLDAADAIPHYRTQLWNNDRVAENPFRFRRMLYRVLEKEPEAEWVNENFFREVAEDGTTSGQFWEEGETWSQVYARDPAAAREVLEEWGFAVRQSRLNYLKDKESSLKDILEDYGVNDAAELETRWGTQVDTLERRIDLNERKLARLKTEKEGDPRIPDAEIKKTDDRIKRYYLELTHIEDNLKQLTEVFDNLEELNRLQRRFRTKNRAKSSSTLKKIRKNKAAQAKASARRTVDESIRELQEAIGTGTMSRVSDLPMDRARAGNSRLMRRVLNLQEEQFGDDAAFFLEPSSEAKMTQYTHTIGRRLAYIEAMQPYLNKIRPGTKLDGTEADITTLHGIINEEFAKAIENTTDQRMIRNLKREQKKARLFLKEQLEAWNNIGLNDSRLNGWIEVMLGGTAAHALGTLVITQATDIPTAAMALPRNVATGRFTNSLMNPVRKMAIRADIEEIKKSDYLMYSALRGLNAYETARWEKLVDIRSVSDQIADVHSGANTGALGLARSFVREGGKVQAYASLAPFWNRWVQTSFGHVFMESMNDGIMRWDSLKQIDKDHFARLGLGQRQAAKMKKLLSDPKKTRQLGPNGSLKVPIREAWPEDLYGQYLGVLRRAQNEALISPEIGDMPALVTRHPLARLVYQFSSFAFAWSGQVMRKAVQRGIMHPDEVGVYSPLIAGLAFGTMVMYLKNTLVYGKTHEEVMNKAPADLIWDVMSRTPFVTGMGNSLTEGFFQFAGHAINEHAGMKLLPEEANYFKRSQGPVGALGPAFGVFHGTYYKALQQAAEGDHEKAFSRIVTQLPILNTIMLKPIVDEIYGDD